MPVIVFCKYIFTKYCSPLDKSPVNTYTQHMQPTKRPKQTRNTSNKRQRRITTTTHLNAMPMMFRLYPETEKWVREYCRKEGRTLSAAGEKAFRLLKAHEEAR